MQRRGKKRLLPERKTPVCILRHMCDYSTCWQIGIISFSQLLCVLHLVNIKYEKLNLHVGPKHKQTKKTVSYYNLYFKFKKFNFKGHISFPASKPILVPYRVVWEIANHSLFTWTTEKGLDGPWGAAVESTVAWPGLALFFPLK